MKIRVFLADDHHIFREAQCGLLAAQPDMVVVGQTGDGTQVMEQVAACAPHVVCMDITMPGMNGIDVTRDLKRALPMVKVVALSAYSDQRHVMEMLGAGASGFVTKMEASDELLRAIRAVLGGRTYLCPDVSGEMAGALVEQGRRSTPQVVLGERERQVLKLVTTGYTSAQIAEALSIATSTVDVHRRNIMRKLDRHSVAALTRYVVDNERGERPLSQSPVPDNTL
ncbi:DNA-binding response regulator [Rhodoferax lacus]|uniref:DNA-binding response regulator n=1 Tax=Rhodoferax lacus TaxID=2184758 RepID=A0A3E1R8M7_9BURK|nr:response regulator transcription factor [Rhodoferax lacus]RFO95719.1 DNA-binding response regulator [Rhodoferax lacus]